MKTTLLILMLACVGAWAQTNAIDPNQAAQDEAMRRAMRAALVGDTNVAVTVAATNIPAAVSNGSVVPARAPRTNFPSFPAFPALPTHPRPARTAINPSAFAGNTNQNLPGVIPVSPGIAATNATPPEQILPAGTFNFPQAPLESVLPIYADLVHRTILRAQNLPQVQITLQSQTDLTRSEAIQALDSVLAMNGIVMVNIGDKFVKAVQKPEVFQTAPPLTTRDASEVTEGDEYVTHLVRLKYTKPSEIQPALVPFAQIPNSIFPMDNSQILIIRDFASNVKRMLELIEKIDVTAPLDFDQEVIPIKYAKASDIASALSSLGGSAGTTIGHSTTTGNRGTGTGFGNGLNPGGGGFGGAMGTGTYNPGNPGGINQQNNNNPGGAQRTSSFGDRLSSIVKKIGQQGEFQVFGQTKIIADERTNSLLVFAGKEDMKMIKNIIEKLDIVLAQVLIESIIMEVSLDNSHALGFSYLQNRPVSAGKHGYFGGIGGINNGTFLNSGSFTAPSGTNSLSIPSGFSYFANFGNDFQATATAIAADSRINVLSRPRVQTSHGVMANIQVGQQVPMISGTYFGGVSGVGSSSQYQQQFVGISLQVTPLINPDGLVVMDIQQQVQQLGPNYKIDNNDVPSTTTRNASATVSVKDRDTIILGGMISSSKNRSNSGVPLLKDIPGLGALFRSSSVNDQRVELIVLIRPTVLPTPESAALVATHERGRLPGVRAAEAEERRDEMKRLKQAEKVKVPQDNN